MRHVASTRSSTHSFECIFHSQQFMNVVGQLKRFS